MKPYEHQIEIATQAYEILRQYGLVYLSMLERTGKTLTSILVAEASRATKILVVTKKNAIGGWDETIKAYKPTKHYTVINYESVQKVGDVQFDLIVVDEAHNMATYPKPSKRWQKLFKYTKGKPIIYLSATPYAENVGQLFNQLRLSSWTPLKYKNFYDFFRAYGIPSMTRTPYGLVETYSKYKTEDVLDAVDHLFISKTRIELGFEHEPEDVVHKVPYSLGTKKLVERVVKDEMLELPTLPEPIPMDTPMKLRTTIYQIEGGWVRLEGKCYFMGALERIEAMKKDFDTGENCVIMAHFICEQEHLKDYFPDAEVVSSNKMAEGVDYSHIDNLIIYSSDFSTARAFQRRARQANMKRDKPIKVHFYLIEGGISEEVYETVYKKRTNFVKDSYERWANKWKHG